MKGLPTKNRRFVPREMPRRDHEEVLRCHHTPSLLEFYHFAEHPPTGGALSTDLRHPVGL